MADKEDNDLDHTNPTGQIIAQGRALVRAIECLHSAYTGVERRASQWVSLGRYHGRFAPAP
jgi:hypothetical protein